MSSFRYSARSGAGDPVKGELQALSVADAGNILAAQGLIPVNIQEQVPFFDLSKIFNLAFKRAGVKMKDLSIFFRQLSVLSAAGVPLIESLIAVEDQIISKNFKRIVREIETDISGGKTFSQTLAKYPAVFSGLVVSMVEAGERSGTLEDVMNKITFYYEKEMQFRQKIQSALRYPLIVLAALSIAFFIVITFIVPQFAKIYGAQKVELPLPTRILIGLNFIIAHYWWLIVIVLAGSFFLLRLYVNTPAGRYKLDEFLLKIPVFGVLITKVSLSRFFRMLSSMLSSGIPIIAGLDITTTTADNVVISQTIKRMRDRVVAGGGLAGTMREEKIFPSTAVQMMAVGEMSGTLEKMLIKSADYFDEETDYMISNLMSLLEPFIILFLGFLVMLLALGIFLPMWNMMSLYTR